MMKDHYTKAELAEFKAILTKKLEAARSDLDLLKASLESIPNDAKGDDLTGERLSRSETQQLKSRQEKFIDQLMAALGRISNGSYGYCRITGKLIPKDRLRLVPHTTLSIEARQGGVDVTSGK